MAELTAAIVQGLIVQHDKDKGMGEGDKVRRAKLQVLYEQLATEELALVEDALKAIAVDAI